MANPWCNQSKDLTWKQTMQNMYSTGQKKLRQTRWDTKDPTLKITPKTVIMTKYERNIKKWWRQPNYQCTEVLSIVICNNHCITFKDYQCSWCRSFGCNNLFCWTMESLAFTCNWSEKETKATRCAFGALKQYSCFIILADEADNYFLDICI